MINPDDIEATEKIVAKVEAVTGSVVSVFTENLIDAMLAEGRSIPAIINTAIARERDGANEP